MSRVNSEPPGSAADSETLLYEFEMLCRLAISSQKVDPAEDKWAHNAHVESFAIHARALIHFFCPPSERDRHPTNVFASDFIPGWPHHQSHNLERARNEANGYIAHITTERRQANQTATTHHTWDFRGLTLELGGTDGTVHRRGQRGKTRAGRPAADGGTDRRDAPSFPVRK